VGIFDTHGKFNGKEFEYVSHYLDSEGYGSDKSWTQRFEEEVSKHKHLGYIWLWLHVILGQVMRL